MRPRDPWQLPAPEPGALAVMSRRSGPAAVPVRQMMAQMPEWMSGGCGDRYVRHHWHAATAADHRAGVRRRRGGPGGAGCLAGSPGLSGRVLGIWPVGAGLNYVALAWHAVALSQPGALEIELDGVDTRRELRRNNILQLCILVPVSLAGSRRPQRSSTAQIACPRPPPAHNDASVHGEDATSPAKPPIRTDLPQGR